MTNKEKYQQLCEQVQLPVFLQYWWLEGVSAGKDWDILLFYDDEQPERIVAALPYEYERHLRRLFIRPAQLTPYGGLWIADDVRQSPELLESLCVKVQAELQRMKVVSYRQPYGPSSSAPDRLAAMGFSLLSRATWVLDNVQDTEAVLAGFSKNKRRKMEKTVGLYTTEDIDPEEFYRFCQMTSLQKKRRMLYTRELLLVLWEKASERKQARLMGIRGQHGELLAAAFLVWDRRQAYMLVNTFDHDVPDNGARELMTMEAIRQAKALGVGLDFVNPRDYLRHYGARRQTYQVVMRSGKTFVLLHRIINWWQHL